ncbi:MAG: hypothetical protein U0R50_09655 [Gaiellales bacterium]
MNRRSVILLGLGIVLAATAATTANGRGGASPKVVTTRGAIESLGIDGQMIAYDLEARELGCNTVHARNAHTGKDVVVSGKLTCEADSTSTGSGVPQVVIAGTRVAWIVNLGGNTESTDFLFTAKVTGKEVQVAKATRTGDIDGELDGDWIANLAGDGDLIVVNRWKALAGGVQDGQQLARIQNVLKPLASGPGALHIRGADTGRIVVQNGRAVLVYSQTGALIQQFAPAAVPIDVAIRKDFVVVLTEAATLAVHDAASGAKLDTIPVPAGGRSLDLHANIATFVVGKTVRAVRLATGKQAVIATAPKAIVDAQIDDAGLVYAYNPTTGVKGVGKLVFVPLSLVQAKLT